MTTNPLFHEVYGTYFSIVSDILNYQQPLSQKELERLIKAKGFDESAMTMLPSLLNDKQPWLLLTETLDQHWKSVTKGPVPPLQTDLERRWLKSLLSDPRLLYFMDQYEITDLSQHLQDVTPLFQLTDITYFDQFKQREDFIEQSQQRNHFKRLLAAIHSREPLKIDYQRHVKAPVKTGIFLPIKLEYSQKNNLFRLKAWRVLRNSRFEVTLNLNRMVAIQSTNHQTTIEDKAITSRRKKTQVTCLVIDHRDALKRSMHHFADYHKTTRRLSDQDTYELTIHYDTSDETELLIRLLSFGPFLTVISPDSFVGKIKERIDEQAALMDTLRN